MKTSVIFAAAAALTLLAAVAWGEEAFAPPKISQWNGKTWGKLSFGQTSQEGIKRDFKDGRGDFRNSVELKQQTELPYKINALFPDVEKTAKLDGLVIRYRNDNSDGLPVSELAQALGDEAMQTRYPSVRHEDWRIVAFPRRGILAFVLNDKASWLLLGDPGKIASVVGALELSEPSPVTDVPDPAQDKAKEIVYGDVEARFDLTRLTLSRKDRERDLLESDLRRAGDGRGRRGLRFERGASGEYSLSISARAHDDKTGDGIVTASLTGTTPYGKVSVSASESFRVEKGRKRLEDTSYYRAITQAQREVEDKAIRALDAQGPPTPETVRREQWNRLVEQYRTTKAGTAGSLL